MPCPCACCGTTGACCSSGSCTQTTCPACEASGGQWQGYGTQCVDGSCPCDPPADSASCEKCENGTPVYKCSEAQYCCNGTCQWDPCGDPCSSDGDCPEGQCCVDGYCTECPPGCCCIDGQADPTKTSQSACSAAGGVWLANANCADYPCQGGCCCYDGAVELGFSESQCEDCTVTNYCEEYLYLEDPEQPCPEGWSGSGGNCFRTSIVNNCSDCYSAGGICTSYENGLCGTWYPECAVSTRWRSSAYGGGTFTFIGPNGTCALNVFSLEQTPAGCGSDLNQSVGAFESYDDCASATDSWMADNPGQDMSYCAQICLDTNNPLP